MTFIQILHDYGWAGVLLIMVSDKILPFFIRSVFPQFMKKQQGDMEMARLEQKHRFDMETRQVDAMERLAASTDEIKRFMVSVDGRLGGLERSAHITPRYRKKMRSQ